MTEVGHLISFLMHAKFSDDVRLNIVGSPTMRGILSGLLEEGRALHEYSGWFSRAVSWEIGNEEGVNPPPSFFKIEDDLKGALGRDNVDEELKELLYPYTWIRRRQ